MKGRQVIGTLKRAMNWRNVSMETKRGMRNSVILSALNKDQKHGHGMQHISQEYVQWR